MSLRARIALLLVWLALLAALLAYILGALKISTDLRSFMPPARTPEQRLLLDEIGEGPGSRLLLLALEGDEPDVLADISKALVPKIRADARFVRVLNGEGDIGALAEDLLPYRYLLSPTLDTQPLDRDFLRAELEQRVQDLGSPAAAWLKPLLGRDPTLEMLKLAEAWVPPGEPERYAEVWFSRDGRMPDALAQTKAVLARGSIPIELAVVSREAVCRRYGAEAAPAFYLFRPDQHVAARWRGLVAGEVEAALVRATGGGTHATDARP